MKKIIIKSLDKVIVSLLVIMGVFSSCNKDDIKPMYGVMPEYGVPMGEYGKSIVINEEISNKELTPQEISEIHLQGESVL